MLILHWIKRPNQPAKGGYMNYLEFMTRSPEDIYLAIMDRLGVKLGPAVEHDHNDRSWAEDLFTNNLK
jgi:hypothetical protein